VLLVVLAAAAAAVLFLLAVAMLRRRSHPLDEVDRFHVARELTTGWSAAGAPPLVEDPLSDAEDDEQVSRSAAAHS
jgi:hypothetical protein